jgi:hypothetical protein
MAMDGFELAGRKIKVGRPLHGQQQQAAAQLPQVGIPGLGVPGLGLGLGALGGLPVLGMPGAAPLQVSIISCQWIIVISSIDSCTTDGLSPSECFISCG